ncbi:MAG: response regulator [Oligoflexia bacterium]|nr:response regulator [Oligoflexia bacterium]
MTKKTELNLLIVDDSVSTRAVYKHYLKNDDKYLINVFEAQSGIQGLKILKSEKIDCILLDYRLPDLLGSVVVEKIRVENKYQFLPIVMFTGHSSEEVAVESIKKGANDYLVKGSVTKDKFLKTIHTAIEECHRDKQKELTQRQNANMSKLASIGVLTGGVAHELNNPLAGIIGLAENILNDPRNVDKTIDRINKIIASSNRIKKIIDQLRQFSRDSTSIKDRRHVNINVSIKKIYSKYFDGLKKNDVEMMLDLDENIPLVWCESKQVEIALGNLLMNSLDAFESSLKERKYKGTKNIKIVTLTYNDGVRIIIEDNAGGMSPHVEEHAFDPFFTTKDIGKGTGLGMSVTFGVIDKMGGNIALINKEGEGVRFEIWLPGLPIEEESLFDQRLKEEDVQRITAAVAPTIFTNTLKEEKKKQKPSIIIIDDEEVICEVLADFLSEEFEVTTLSDSQEALKRIEKKKYDLVVTDLNMPNVNGLDILFATQNFWPTTPVVFISGHAREEVEMKTVIERGAKDILSKPFVSMDEVVVTLKKVIVESESKS